MGHLSKKWASLSETRDLLLVASINPIYHVIMPKILNFSESLDETWIFTEIWRFRNFLKWQIFWKIGASGF